MWPFESREKLFYHLLWAKLCTLHMQSLARLTRLFPSFHTFLFIPLSLSLFPSHSECLSMHIALSNECLMCATRRQGSRLFSYLPPSSRTHWAAQTSCVLMCVYELVCVCVWSFLSCEFGMCSSLAVPQEGSVGLWASSPPASLPTLHHNMEGSHPLTWCVCVFKLIPWFLLSWENSSQSLCAWHTVRVSCYLIFAFLIWKEKNIVQAKKKNKKRMSQQKCSGGETQKEVI